MLLLYPPSAIVLEETVGGVGRREYVVEREDGEGTLLVKQASDEAPLREAFVLAELGFSRGEDRSGIPAPFPLVMGSARGVGWTACALSNFEAPSLSRLLEEDPSYLDEQGSAFDVVDGLLSLLQALQSAGVTHRAINADTVLILAGDIPALVSFDLAVAQGMPYAEPQLPPNVAAACEGVDGDMPGQGGGASDVYALGVMFGGSIKGGARRFSLVTELMAQRRRHDRVTHVLSLRLLLGSCIEERADLVAFRGKITGAREARDAALRAAPSSGVAHNNLGGVYFESQMLNDALSVFLASMDLDLPFRSGAMCNVAAVRQMMCSWDHRSADSAYVTRVIDAGGGEVRSVRNLYALALNLSMPQHLAVSRGGADYAYGKAREAWVPVTPHLALLRGDELGGGARPRLGVAYLSSDLLTSHAVAGSMRMVLSLHDRGKVDVSLFVTKPEQVVAAHDDAERAGLGGAALVDGSEMSPGQLAQALNSRHVHVVIDCNGQTGKDAMAALAMRPAAIQVHYLGFPSTLGASFIDHIVGDRFVSPPDLAGFYAEKFLSLSSTFQVTSHRDRQKHPLPDSRQAVDPMKGGVGQGDGESNLRAYHGLRERGPLLCNFNQHFKLDPEMFGAWARIVKRVKGSTLILLRYPEESEPHLRQAARENGLTGEQLLLLPKAPLTEHLARTSMCDLFVDNREYNSGTTCTDALWAGAPTISLPREKHAGRHAASMLSSLGPVAGALQARDLADYEQMAVAVLKSMPSWHRVFKAVVGSRAVSPLWMPEVWVRDMERALSAAFEWHVSAGADCSKGGWREEAVGGGAKCHAKYAHIVL